MPRGCGTASVPRTLLCTTITSVRRRCFSCVATTVSLTRITAADAAAPLDELTTYIEDIALWGVNTLVVLLPGPSSFANGERTTAPDAPQIAELK